MILNIYKKIRQNFYVLIPIGTKLSEILPSTQNIADYVLFRESYDTKQPSYFDVTIVEREVTENGFYCMKIDIHSGEWE